MVGLTRRGMGLVLVGAAVVVGVPGTAALAAPVESGTFVDVFSVEQEDYCEVAGLDVVVTGEFSARYRLYSRKGVLYGHQTSRLTRTVTNPDTGLSVTDTAVVLERDRVVTDNGDGTATVLIMATGNSTLSDSTGTVLARDPGQLRFELLLDLGGTPLDPSDDEMLEFLGVVRESTGRSDDFCAVAVPAIT